MPYATAGHGLKLLLLGEGHRITILIDITLNLTAAQHARAQVEKHMRSHEKQPLYRSERWKVGGQEFLRVLWAEDHDTFNDFHIDLGERAKHAWPATPGTIVSIAYRNIAYAIRETIPPNLRPTHRRMNGVDKGKVTTAHARTPRPVEVGAEPAPGPGTYPDVATTVASHSDQDIPSSA